MEFHFSECATNQEFGANHIAGPLDSLNTLADYSNRDLWDGIELGHRFAPPFVRAMPLADTQK